MFLFTLFPFHVRYFRFTEIINQRLRHYSCFCDVHIGLSRFDLVFKFKKRLVCLMAYSREDGHKPYKKKHKPYKNNHKPYENNRKPYKRWHIDPKTAIIPETAINHTKATSSK